MQIYNEEDRSKMPLELANALSHERETVDDPEIRQQALEAIYLISLQVNPYEVNVANFLFQHYIIFILLVKLTWVDFF